MRNLRNVRIGRFICVSEFIWHKSSNGEKVKNSMNVRKVGRLRMEANMLETLIIQTFLNIGVISPYGKSEDL